ncbi:MAG: uracil-DNA glycosylase [Pseudomonadota bacterium]
MTAPLDDPHRDALLAALSWQIEAGVDECLGETAQNRFEEIARRPAAAAPEKKPPMPGRKPASRPASPVPAADDAIEAVTAAAALAKGAQTLDDLRRAIEDFDGCSLKKGARSTVFADGHSTARVMFIGEAPGRDEDRAGKPFVGRSGQLLDRMLATIGLDRQSDDPATAAYITNVLPWRPVDNRDPSTDEAVMLWSFLARHIELAAPEMIVALGKTPSAVLTERPIAITRERGRWLTPGRGGGRPVLLTFHPAYLLRSPHEKAKSWRDLMSLRAVLDGEAPKLEG